MENEAREVGTIVKAAEGHILITPTHTLQLESSNVDFEPWEGQRVVISAHRIERDAAVVLGVNSMMSETELRECTSFVLSRHGRRAREHAQARLDSATARNHPSGIEIWKCICRQIDEVLAHEAFPRQ